MNQPMQYPGYPQGPMPQGYGPQMPMMPGGGWAMPAAPPAAPVNATLEAFRNQPAGAEGKSLVFKDRPVGTTYLCVVARDLADADVRAVEYEGKVQTRGDGNAKLLMVVPVLVMPDQQYPDGKATLWLKGASWTQVNAAMSRVGDHSPVPRAGAMIQITLTGIRPIPGKNAAFEYSAVYWPPEDPATTQFTEALNAAPKMQQAAPQFVQPQQMQQFVPQGQHPAQYASPGVGMTYQPTGAPGVPQPQDPAAQYAAYAAWQAQQAQQAGGVPPQAATPAAAPAAPTMPQTPAAPQPPAPAQAASAPPQQAPAAVAPPAPAAVQPAANGMANDLTAGMSQEQLMLFQKLAAQQAQAMAGATQ